MAYGAILHAARTLRLRFIFDFCVLSIIHWIFVDSLCWAHRAHHTHTQPNWNFRINLYTRCVLRVCVCLCVRQRGITFGVYYFFSKSIPSLPHAASNFQCSKPCAQSIARKRVPSMMNYITTHNRINSIHCAIDNQHIGLMASKIYWNLCIFAHNTPSHSCLSTRFTRINGNPSLHVLVWCRICISSLCTPRTYHRRRFEQKHINSRLPTRIIALSLSKLFERFDENRNHDGRKSASVLFMNELLGYATDYSGER